MQVWIRRFALLLLPLGFLAVMVAAPLLSLAFYDGEGAWAEVVADDYMRLRLGWTVAQAVLTCVLVTALGVPAAWVLARMDFAGRRTVLRLLMLPFVAGGGHGCARLVWRTRLLAAGWQDTGCRKVGITKHQAWLAPPSIARHTPKPTNTELSPAPQIQHHQPPLQHRPLSLTFKTAP